MEPVPIMPHTFDTAHAFFSTQITKANSRAESKLSQNSKTYLANLLTDAMDTPSYRSFFAGDADSPTQAYMRICILGAVGKDERSVRTADAIQVGNSTLFHTGFFPDAYMGNKDRLSWYASVGAHAFAMVASRMKREANLQETLEELAIRFGDAMNLLAWVRAGIQAESLRTDEDLFHALKRWELDKNPIYARALEMKGVPVLTYEQERRKTIH